jgi:hypothetical protein
VTDLANWVRIFEEYRARGDRIQAKTNWASDSEETSKFSSIALKVIFLQKESWPYNFIKESLKRMKMK